MKITDLQNTSGKAKNMQSEPINTLLSYNTEVATYNEDTKKIVVFGWFSATTGRHINAFFELHNLPKMTKKELFKNFNLTK